MKTIKKLINNNLFIYGMIFISVLQLLNFYKANSLICLGTFGLSYYIVSMSTKNQGLCLLVANIISIFLLGCEKSDILEGLTIDQAIDRKLQDYAKKSEVMSLVEDQTTNSLDWHKKLDHKKTPPPSNQGVRKILIKPNIQIRRCDKNNEIIKTTMEKYKKATYRDQGWNDIYKTRLKALIAGRTYKKSLEGKGCNLKNLGLTPYPEEEYKSEKEKEIKAQAATQKLIQQLNRK